MYSHSNARRGQFIILAAVLILIVMVSAVIFLYSNLPSQTILVKDVANATGSVINSINTVYASGASMYSTILNVTGNYTYATLQSNSVMASGFSKLATLYSSYGLSMSKPSVSFKAVWYSPYSYTLSQGALVFNLSSYDVYGVNVSSTQELAVQVVCTTVCVNNGQATLRVYDQGNNPDSGLAEDMFYFLVYSPAQNDWVKTLPLSFENFQNGTYVLGLPGSSSGGFLVGVRDSRGILVIASSFTKVQFSFSWTGAQSLAGNEWSNLAYLPLTLQILTNGTVQLLGQAAQVSSGSVQPIPPVPVKDIRVNETFVSGKDTQVPFQVEDWTFGYTQPLGLTGEYTLFSNFQMIVTDINTTVDAVTVYWNGTDTTAQSKFSIPPSGYFTNSAQCGLNCMESISNGLVTFDFIDNGGFCTLKHPDTLELVTSYNNRKLGNVTFESANGYNMETDCNFGFVIIPGVVREIAYGGFVIGEFSESTTAYNMLPSIVFLIPAKAPYVTAISLTKFGRDASQSYQRSISSYYLMTLNPQVGPQVGSSAFIQNGTKPTSSSYQSVPGFYCVYGSGPNSSSCIPSGSNVTHYYLWSAVCLATKSQPNRDPCNPSSANVGILNTAEELLSLYSLGLGVDGGNLPYTGFVIWPNNSITVAPYMPNEYALAFSSSFYYSWTGFLWFWPGTQTVGQVSYNLDPYIVSAIFESPPSVGVTIS